jgi:hypothetical protein
MLNLIKLENRIVLDGAGIGDAVEHHDTEHEPQSSETHGPGEQDQGDYVDVTEAVALLAEQAHTAEPLNLILVSNDLPDYQTLVDAAAPGTHVIVYDASTASAEDVIQQVKAFSESQGRPVESLTILSHGGTGYFRLGNQVITTEDIQANPQVWKALDEAMSDGGRIFLMGCNAGQEPGMGDGLLNSLAEATDTDVFGSDNITGGSGDWELESASENASESLPVLPPLDLDQLAEYAGNLQEIIFIKASTQYEGGEDYYAGFSILVYIKSDDPNVDNPAAKYDVNYQCDDPKVAGFEGTTWLPPWPGLAPPIPGYVAWEVLTNYLPAENYFHVDKGEAAQPGDGTVIKMWIVDTQNNNQAVTGITAVPLIVRAKNDAPLLDNSGNMKLDLVLEDDPAPIGQTVQKMLLSVGFDPIRDVDLQDQTGIAVTGVDNRFGTWQYSVNNGTTWTAFGDALSDTSAVVLNRNAMIRLVPDEDALNAFVKNYEPGDPLPAGVVYNSATARLELTEAVSFRAWDQDSAPPNTLLPSGTRNVNTTAFDGPQYNYPAIEGAFSRAVDYTNPITGQRTESDKDEIVSVTIGLVNNNPPPPVVVDGMEYIENGVIIQGNVIVDTDVPTPIEVTLQEDPDDTDMSKVVVEITNGYQNDARGRDQLLFDPEGAVLKVKAAVSADGRVITLTPVSGASASLADFQKAVDAVKFEHVGGQKDGDDPVEGNRTIKVTAFDANKGGGGNPAGIESSEGNGTLFVDAINDSPVLTPGTGTVPYTENNPATPIAADIVLTDVDDDRMTQATVQITGNYIRGEDFLTYTGNAAGITANWNPATGTITLTGLATKAAYQDALRAVNYNSLADRFDNPQKTIEIHVRDENSRNTGFRQGNNAIGGPLEAQAIRTILITPTLDSPIIVVTDMNDLNEDNDNPAVINPDGSYGKLVNTGNTVAELVVSVSDLDQPGGVGIEAVAVTAIDETYGKWEYSLDNGATWNSIGTVSDAHALLLTSTARVRFTPNPDFNTERDLPVVVRDPSMTVRAWDESTGSEGQYVNTSSAAFSANTGNISVEVIAINDRPDLVNVPEREEILLNDPSVQITGISIGDVDLNEKAAALRNQVRVTLSVEKGTITLGRTTGLMFETGDGTDDAVMTFTGLLSDVNAAVAALTYTANATQLNDFINAGNVAQQYDRLNINANDLGNFGQPGPRFDEEAVGLFLGNTGPDIDLDPDDDGGGDPPVGPPDPDNEDTGNINVYFLEPTPTADCTPVFIADPSDPTQLIVDREGDNIIWMEVRLTNPQAGDILAANTSGTGISIVSNGIEPGTGHLVLRFEGTAQDAQYDRVLRTVTFDNESNNPDPTRRMIEVRASDEYNGVSLPVTSRISVVPVNDAPVNSVPAGKQTPVNEAAVFNDISIQDPDAAGGVLLVSLQVDFGRLTATNNPAGAAITGNGTSNVTIQGNLDAVNAALKGLTYTPLNDFTGTDTLRITTNDQGNTGIHPNDISTINGRCVANNGILDGNGNIIAQPGDGTPSDPSAMTDTDTIPITIARSDIDVIPEGPETPDNPLIPITQPGGNPVTGGLGGMVTLPGAVGMVGGIGSPLIEGRGIAGRDFADFCSIEDALRAHLGCRFANTTDFESQFGSVKWADLGWAPPLLDEEFDLYGRLFLKQEGDPGFNVEPGVFLSDLGGLPSPRRVFEQRSDAEDFNDMGPNELRQAFFAQREELDKTWR